MPLQLDVEALPGALSRCGCQSYKLKKGAFADWIVRNRPSEQRTLLEGILKVWGIDLRGIKLSDGKPLWDTVHAQVLKQRNSFIHEGTALGKEHADLAIECSNAFRKGIVERLADKLGFTIAKTGKWAEVVRPSVEPGHLGGVTKYVPRSPFRT